MLKTQIWEGPGTGGGLGIWPCISSMLNDSEARLSQMLEASGLRLGNLNSGQSLGFGGNMSGGHANQQNQAKTSSKADADDGNSASAITERSENLINIQA